MIPPELQDIIKSADKKMDQAVAHYKKELSHIRAGKAQPSILEGVKVDYYGSQTPLNQLANVSVPDPRLIVVSPYDKGSIQAVEKAIQAAGLGLNPNNDGNIIRIPLPILSEERRKELVKRVNELAEEARISIRNTRREANDEVEKKVKQESLPEDSLYEAQDEIQKLTDQHTEKVGTLSEKKEKEIMTV